MAGGESEKGRENIFYCKFLWPVSHFCLNEFRFFARVEFEWRDFISHNKKETRAAFEESKSQKKDRSELVNRSLLHLSGQRGGGGVETKKKLKFRFQNIPHTETNLKFPIFHARWGWQNGNNKSPSTKQVPKHNREGKKKTQNNFHWQFHFHFQLGELFLLPH